MKIAVVGSINQDVVVTVDRIPLKGETLKGTDLNYLNGGKGANQAFAMAKLGANVGFFGCVGNDDAGAHYISDLKEVGVDTDNIEVIHGVPTGMAMITVGDSDNTIVIIEGANGCVTKDYIDRIQSELMQYQMVVLQHEIPMETVEYVVDICYRHNIPVVLNPAPAHPVSVDTIEKVTYLTPNETEAQLLFGNSDINQLLQKYPEKLIITLGGEGVATCLKSGEVTLVPARKTVVADTTGAGDTLNGAFAVCMAQGMDIIDALRFSNAAASLSVEKFGAQGGMPTKEEVEAVLNE